MYSPNVADISCDPTQYCVPALRVGDQDTFLKCLSSLKLHAYILCAFIQKFIQDTTVSRKLEKKGDMCILDTQKGQSKIAPSPNDVPDYIIYM